MKVNVLIAEINITKNGMRKIKKKGENIENNTQKKTSKQYMIRKKNIENNIKKK